MRITHLLVTRSHSHGPLGGMAICPPRFRRAAPAPMRVLTNSSASRCLHARARAAQAVSWRSLMRGDGTPVRTHSRATDTARLHLPILSADDVAAVVPQLERGRVDRVDERNQEDDLRRRAEHDLAVLSGDAAPLHDNHDSTEHDRGRSNFEPDNRVGADEHFGLRDRLASVVGSATHLSRRSTRGSPHPASG